MTGQLGPDASKSASRERRKERVMILMSRLLPRAVSIFEADGAKKGARKPDASTRGWYLLGGFSRIRGNQARGAGMQARRSRLFACNERQ